ncbi:MAG: histidine phosphatase family protein [Polyangiaceae bacterium]|nr:histidine phosphatase family protein [Polyangiaceae bacterium]
MDILFVRHGESEANAQGIMQGSLDSPLSERGREQAAVLGEWLKARGLEFEAAYCSPLSRAKETAHILCERLLRAPPQVEADLAEISSGDLQGLDAAQIAERFPSFMQRDITTLGDFAEYGGESYDAVQQRARRYLDGLEAAHRNPAETPKDREEVPNPQRILVVAHGGIIFQLVKQLICLPVPQVMILRYGNCSSTLIRMRERRGVYIGEVRWHMPLELIGGETRDPSVRLFR